jgi:hypothetical protein
MVYILVPREACGGGRLCARRGSLKENSLRYNHVIMDEGEVFRYRKADRIRTYGLRPVAGAGAELWVVSSAAGRAARSRKLLAFTSDRHVDAVLEDVRRELRAGGWLEA